MNVGLARGPFLVRRAWDGKWAVEVCDWGLGKVALVCLLNFVLVGCVGHVLG